MNSAGTKVDYENATSALEKLDVLHSCAFVTRALSIIVAYIT